MVIRDVYHDYTILLRLLPKLNFTDPKEEGLDQEERDNDYEDDHILISDEQPKENVEEEEDWYDDENLPDILSNDPKRIANGEHATHISGSVGLYFKIFFVLRNVSICA